MKRSDSLPPALAVIARQGNLAADAALVEVLPHMDAGGRAAVLAILAERGHGPSLAKVVGRYYGYEPELQSLLADRAADLSVGIRLAVDSPEFAEREGLIELIARSRCTCLVYLLGDALRHKCPRTRALAANALRRLTDDHLNGRQDLGLRAESTSLAGLEDVLVDTLNRAVHTWEAHRQCEALEAALWLSKRTISTIRRKLEEPRQRVSGMIVNFLANASDPRMAEFTVRALGIRKLRSAAAGAIAGADKRVFVEAVLAHVELMDDPEIVRGCRSIRNCAWLCERFSEMVGSTDGGPARAVRLLDAIGCSAQRKGAVLAAMFALGPEEWRRAVLGKLVHDPSDAATELLTLIVARYDDHLSQLAARALRRRSQGAGPSGRRLHAAPEVAAVRTLIDRYWRDQGPEGGKGLEAIVAARRRDQDGLVVCLSDYLRSDVAIDRVRALRLIGKLGLGSRLQAQFFTMTHDADPLVRSHAVAALGRLPGPTSERLARAALNDPDERVQATAIEVVASLRSPDRIRLIKTKLASLNHRVQANAVKALLPCEIPAAGDVLINMLETPSPAHRLSALWVVESLRLRSVSGRVEKLARDDPHVRVRQRAEQVLLELAGRSGGGRDSSNSAKLKPAEAAIVGRL